MQQTVNTLLMIRPVSFKMNLQTAVNNYYQKEIENMLPVTINKKAQIEFDELVRKLTKKGVDVLVIEDTLKPDTPDALFPNNWISFHENGDVALYPMFAENRRLERREDVLDRVEEKGFLINNIVDYTEAETEEIYLEGTGSIVLDRQNSIAYCALSPRTDEELFIEFCEDFEYTPVIFKANQTVNSKREAIYHTNVLLSIAEQYAIVCLDAIDDKKERKNLLKYLKLYSKEVIVITEAQVCYFAGNTLQVKNVEGKLYLLMSTSAYNSLQKNQLEKIEKYNEIIHSSINTIEICGGGSVRCMMAEIFLPKK